MFFVVKYGIILIVIDQEQSLRKNLEQKIADKLVDAPTFRHGHKIQSFDLDAKVFEQWNNRPPICMLDTMPVQNPARLILSQQEAWEEEVMKTVGCLRRKRIIDKIIPHEAHKSAQVHTRIQGFPDYITLIYYLGLPENQPVSLTSYQNQPLRNPGEGPYIPRYFTKRKATLADLEMFNKFLDQSKPI